MKFNESISTQEREIFMKRKRNFLKLNVLGIKLRTDKAF